MSKERITIPSLDDEQTDKGTERFLEQGHAAGKRESWEWSPAWSGAKTQTFVQKSLLSPGLHFHLLVSFRKSPGESAMLSKDVFG